MLKVASYFTSSFLDIRSLSRGGCSKSYEKWTPSVLEEFQTFSLKEPPVLNKTVKQCQKKRCAVLYMYALRFKVNITIPSTRIIRFSHFHRDFHVGLWSSVFFFCSFRLFLYFPSFSCLVCIYSLRSTYRAVITPPSAFTGAIFCGYTQNKANCHARCSFNFQLHTNMSQIVTVSLAIVVVVVLAVVVVVVDS
jgi:hypothetical protein